MDAIELITLGPEAVALLVSDQTEFEKSYNLRLGVNAEAVSELARQEATGWRRYLAVDPASREVVGHCGFKGAPDAEGVVEISYFTFPSHEGHGCATRMTARLVEIAFSDKAVRRIIARTPPRCGAGRTILERNRFHFNGEIRDSEQGNVWEWELDRDLFRGGPDSGPGLS
jgi:RimJ/RimL family protein N-acetyltransferase